MPLGGRSILMGNLCFADCETRSLADVTQVGAYSYARHPSTDVVVWAYAFDGEPAKVWSPAWAWGRKPDRYPDDLIEHVRSGGIWIAWNAFFDRHIWNCVMVPKYGWPKLELGQVLCAQAQAEASNLPGKLEKACLALGTQYKKDSRGPSLIRLLSNGTRENWNREAYETSTNMGSFRAYGRRDVESMREIWLHTIPLTVDQWCEYHASELINDNGVGVDLEFAQAAQDYAQAEFKDLNKELAAATGDPRMTVTNHIRKAKWIHEALSANEEMQMLVRRPDGDDGRKRFSADRSTREALAEMLLQSEYRQTLGEKTADKIAHVIELIESGNSAAVRKFTAICRQEYGGRIYGQYSFNGAGQTGRFSSRGVQIHNTIRAPVEAGNPDRALDAMDAVLANKSPEYLQQEFGYPVSRLLARLIRPTFIARDGYTFVWADWSQIEARVLPWLSASPGGNRKLDIFVQGKDPYIEAATQIFKKSRVDKDERQIGKVAELALGFGGGLGAFSAMSRSYNIALPDEIAQNVIAAWRQSNLWCVQYWDALWQAAIAAYKNPLTWFHAGRVRYLFTPEIMRGTLVCALPDNRLIAYPQFKYERVKIKVNKKVTRMQLQASFVRGFGSGYARVPLWHGTLAENITQGTAASFLRNALVELQSSAVLHTHDEIMLEVEQEKEAIAREWITEVMTEAPDWAEGLPLSVDVESGPYYTKGIKA